MIFVRVLLLSVIALLEILSFAGAQSIQGKVVSSTDGNALAGVSVLVKGESAGTSTDDEGRFTISNVKPGITLIFTFVGYERKEVQLANQNELRVELDPVASSLEQVVVVGYGTRKKRDITGAISSINVEDINNTPVKNVLSAMQGRIAGMQVISNSGAPGDGISVVIRGQSSLNAGNSPLYVIDGIPIESGSLSQLNGHNSHGLNPLSYINPSDIASIEVLKDASSTAIYGSRAANGVVMITTKSGRDGKARINLNYYTGISNIGRHLDVLNASEWRSNVLDAYKNLDDYNNATTPSVPHWTVLDSLNPMNNGDIDWQREMYRTAYQNQADISVDGGTEKARYALSTSLLDQDGIFLGSNYKRITSKLNTDFDISPKVKVGYNFMFAHELNDRINAGGDGNESLVQSILTRPPTYSLTYPDGSPINYFIGKRNPVGLAKEVTQLNKTNRLIGKQYVEYEILKNLTLRADVSIDFLSMKEDEFFPTTVDYRPGYNRGAVRSSTNFTWANQDYLTYKTTFSEDHNLGVMAGFSQQGWKFEVTGLDGMYFASDRVQTLNGAGTISNQEVNRTDEHGLVSYFGRVEYDYKGKYLFQANLRADGSSRFGKNNRFGYFPSASAAWRFTDESVFRGLAFLNDGKIRMSVGQTGNEAIGNYTSQGEYTIGTNYLENSGASPTVMPNTSLTWETSTQYDIGLDLSLFNYRLTLAADAYIKNTSDLLFGVPIPRTTGFSTITQNLGKIENKGLEMALTTRNFVGKFKWNSEFNISFNRNKIVSLPEAILTNGFIQNGKFHILRVGQPIGVFYGYRFLGVYADSKDNSKSVRYGSSNGKVFGGGDPIWEDKNGDNVINSEDRMIIGNAQPSFVGGFNNDFSYANFSLSVFYQFSYGNQIYSDLNRLRNSVRSYDNVSRDALNRWKQPGDQTNYPRPIRSDPLETDSRVSDRWIEDGSYLKLKNVRLSYDFPKSMIDRLNINQLKVYVSGENLLTWTKYTGYDPDVNSMTGLRLGIDAGSYPQSRTFILGFNVQF